MLRKYIPFLRANILTMFTYRGTVFAWILVDTFSLIMMIFLWNSIYQGQTELNGFSNNEMIIYFLIVGLLGIFASSDAMYMVSDEVRQGQISIYLIKPIRYKTRLLFSDLGSKLGIASIAVPISLLVLIIAASVWRLQLDLSLLNLLLFIFFIPLIYLFIFEYSYLFGLISIYTTNVFGLSILATIIISICSGQLIPLSFYPQPILDLVNLLPFKYLYNYPVSILLGDISPLKGLWGLIQLFIWILLFSGFNRFFFKINEKKIVIYGG